MSTKKKLRKMPIEYLWDGLVLEDDIFNHNGSVLLLPKGELVTEGKLKKLSNFSVEEKYVMVCEECYYNILSKANIPAEIRQKITENQTGYTEIKQNVGGIFHKASEDKEWFHNDEIEPVIQQISEKLNDVDPILIFSCINFPRPMDEGLQRHCLNVAFLNGLMGEWLNLPKEDIRLLVMAGLLHDIGKTKIPEEVLNAPRKLTKEEFAVMRNHPVFSYEMMEKGFDERVRLTARHHHEKMDGKGYPDGLAGDEISLFARITAVSDIYDAMVSKRVYKEGRLSLDVFDSFYKQKYDGLDMDLVMIFLKNMRKNFLNKKVIMSDKIIGEIMYIPPNDCANPIVKSGKIIKQTDDEWYCKEILSEI
ncbi:MAG: HD-GYP domain-containing protein [Lachnospiraceae bacterium]|nr:HD-GYP domain-containing protein [Lachnospiraceae bacterium]